MKKSARKFSIAGIAVVFFCAWQCRELAGAWLHSPFDRFGWLAFALWILPVAIAAAKKNACKTNDTLLLIAAALSLLGAAADLNILQHAGLAAALIAFSPMLRVSVACVAPWILAACAWMPVFGWLGSGFGARAIAITRVTIALSTALLANGVFFRRASKATAAATTLLTPETNAA